MCVNFLNTPDNSDMSSQVKTTHRLKSQQSTQWLTVSFIRSTSFKEYLIGGYFGRLTGTKVGSDFVISLSQSTDRISFLFMGTCKSAPKDSEPKLPELVDSSTVCFRSNRATGKGTAAPLGGKPCGTNQVPLQDLKARGENRANQRQLLGCGFCVYILLLYPKASYGYQEGQHVYDPKRRISSLDYTLSMRPETITQSVRDKSYLPEE